MCDAEVVEHIVDSGRVEDARGSLWQQDLVGTRRQRGDRLGQRVDGCDMDRRQLVVERAVEAVGGKALVDRVDNLNGAVGRGGGRTCVVGDNAGGEVGVGLGG